MEYKLILESWREFLSEEEEPDKEPVSNSEEPSQNTEELKNLDYSYPVIVDEQGNETQNFVKPLDTSEIEGKFNDLRTTLSCKSGKKINIYHNAIDQNVGEKEHPSVYSVCDGVVSKVTNMANYNGQIVKLARLLRAELFVLRPNSKTDEKAAGFPRAARLMYDKSKKNPKWKMNARRALNKIIKNPNWSDLRHNIQKGLGLKWGTISGMIRYYKKKKILPWFPIGGVAITITSNPDHTGRKWQFYYSHLEEVKVKQLDRIGVAVASS